MDKIKKLNKIKLIKMFLFNILLTFSLWSITTTTIENIKTSIEIKQFISRGIFQEDMSTESEKFYKVPRETWQEEKKSFTVSDDILYYGEMGDILLGRSFIGFDIPFATQLISIFFGGHASFVTGELEDSNYYMTQDFVVESSIYGEDDTVKHEGKGFWDSTSYRTEVIGLRVNTNDETRKRAFSSAVSMIGDRYNRTFIFDTKNKHYCLDIMSKAYNHAGINLNYDGFVTTAYDLIFSKHTYMFLYKKTINDVEYIYYLE